MKYFLPILISCSVFFFTDGILAWPADCVVWTDAQIIASDMLKDCARGTSGINLDNTLTWQDGVKDRIVKVAQTAITLWALLAVGAIVWAGIQYTRAYGEDEKLKHAKSTAIFALIGLVLLMGSFPLVDIFINFIYNVTGT